MLVGVSVTCGMRQMMVGQEGLRYDGMWKVEIKYEVKIYLGTLGNGADSSRVGFSMIYYTSRGLYYGKPERKVVCWTVCM